MNASSLLQIDDIYTVSRLNCEVRFILEEAFPYVWVEGEISNFAAPQSGHWYFCLKDKSAQVRAAMFKGSQRKLNFIPKDGMHVLIKARVSLYESRGEFQLIAEEIEERGEGKLQRAFLELKKKLEAAGLFDATHKKAIPEFPKQIGLITSSTGAALCDILHVLKRRYASLPVIIYPTLVQGEAAPLQISEAIQIANRRNECDVLILARGGGSLEDLWSFNEEIVARAIYESKIPIISGIGHEVDFTIADFVADLRAPTPSVAAELATPHHEELMENLKKQQQILIRNIRQGLNTRHQEINWMQKHLAQQHPKKRLREKMQQLDFCELNLVQLMHKVLNKFDAKKVALSHSLYQQAPLRLIKNLEHDLVVSEQQFQNIMLLKLNNKKRALSNAAATLDALSPLATLKRGYAIVTNKEKEIVRSKEQVKVGEEIKVRLQNGSLECVVSSLDGTK